MSAVLGLAAYVGSTQSGTGAHSVARDICFLNRNVSAAQDEGLTLSLFGAPSLSILEQRWDKAGWICIIPSNDRVAPSYR
jgi:hypothetical protein